MLPPYNIKDSLSIVLPRFIEFMTNWDLNVLTHFLSIMGYIVTETDQQTQMAISAGMLKVLGQLLKHPKSSLQKETA